MSSTRSRGSLATKRPLTSIAKIFPFTLSTELVLNRRWRLTSRSPAKAWTMGRKAGSTSPVAPVAFLAGGRFLAGFGFFMEAHARLNIRPGQVGSPPDPSDENAGRLGHLRLHPVGGRNAPRNL